MSDFPSPKKHKTSNWSAIWVLPQVSLSIGYGLGWHAYDQARVRIEVRDARGAGIQAQKNGVQNKCRAVSKSMSMGG
ncbi:hypothetical protein ACLI38_34335, partial [Pseudomonas aeruginosa]